MRGFSKHAPGLLCCHVRYSSSRSGEGSTREEHVACVKVVRAFRATAYRWHSAWVLPDAPVCLPVCFPVLWWWCSALWLASLISWCSCKAAAHTAESAAASRPQEAPPVWNQLPGLLLHIHSPGCLSGPAEAKYCKHKEITTGLLYQWSMPAVHFREFKLLQ